MADSWPLPCAAGAHCGTGRAAIVRFVSRTPLVSLAVAAAVVVLAFVLNPSPERHRLKIKEAISERNPVAGALGLGALAGLASSYRSVGLASYTQVGERTLSVGAFGIVYVP
jgi:hypothetical protein